MAAAVEVVVVFMMLLALSLSKATGTSPSQSIKATLASDGYSYCLSWRLAVEANNERAWRTVPTRCLRYVENYMVGGQYGRDLAMVVEQISTYIKEIRLGNNSTTDAWILDVDDTSISNVLYYRGKRFGCDPFDPNGFKSWAVKGACPAVPPIRDLFRNLTSSGFKVFLITGRDEETLAQSTAQNLHSQGFLGYERLIMRSSAYKGQSAVSFKSAIRKQLVDEGFKVWGNVGDQWSDLAGDYSGERTFKLPNPMYFVP